MRMPYELTGGNTAPNDDEVFKAFQEAEAQATGPVPAATYNVVAVEGKFARSHRKGTPSYKLKVEIADGDHKGRVLWHDYYLTPAARAASKGALAQFEVKDVSQPMADRFACVARVRIRQDDDGIERNEITHLKVVRKIERFPFEEPAGGDGGGAAT
jgi:hypothetical protein